MVSPIILTKRQKLTLTGQSSGAQTDYQMKLDVVYDSNMNADFSDLRFTKSDGETLLSSWLESKIDSTSAVIWVKTDTPADSSTADIYMYYCNATLGDYWNGDTTFLLFDDFNGSTIDTNKWSSTNTPTVSDGKANFVSVKDIESITAYDFAQPCTTIVNMDINVMPTGGNATWSLALTDRNSIVPSSRAAWYAEGSNDRYVGGVTSDWWAGDGKGAALGDSRHEITCVDPSNFKWKVTGVKTFDDTRYELNNYPDCSTRYFNFSTSYSECSVSLYWIAVCKYVSNPATVSFGSEETEDLILSWAKRRKITLTGNSGGAQTDYQVKLDVVYDSDMKSDFSDLRFTDLDGTTLLDAWLEEYVSDSSAVIWVKTDTPADTVEADIYMYYGNSGASSISNIFDTGLTGSDDFTDGVARWTTVSGSMSITSEIASTNPTANHGGVRSSSGIVLSAGNGIAIHTRQKYADIVDTQNAVGFCEQSGAATWYDYNTLIMRATGAQTRWESWGDTYSDHWDAATLDADWHTFDISGYVGSNGIVEISDETGTKSPAWNVVADTYYVWLTKAYNTYQTSHITETDWILVHKYTANPATYVFGSEEDVSGPFSRLQVKYTIGELVGLNTSLLYNVLNFINVNIGYESDLASVDRLQLLQIQVHTESTVNVTLDFQSKFNIDGYILLDMQRVWTIGGSGLNLSQQYNVLNLSPPSDNQRSYCIEGHVNGDVVRSYNIRFPGGYYCKPAIGLNTGIYTPRVIEDLDRKYHNWKVWETKYDFRWKAELYNTETMEGRAILASVQGDYIQLLTETLEAYYKGETSFYSDESVSGFDMNGTYSGMILIPEYGWLVGYLPKGSHEESDATHKLRLDINWDDISYEPTFYPGSAETGWEYTFNKGNYLRYQYDEESKGHGFYKIELLAAGNLPTGLNFEIVVDDEVEYVWVNMAASNLGWNPPPTIVYCCNEPASCWSCHDDHTHKVVWAWDQNYIATKMKFSILSVPDDTGHRYGSYHVMGSKDDWTGDPETMTWFTIGGGSRSANYYTEYEKLEVIVRLDSVEGCKYILTDIRGRYTYSDDDGSYTHTSINNVTQPNFFRMKKVTLLDIPCLESAKFRIVPSTPISHQAARYLELHEIFITRYKDKGYCQQNVWTHFPALYEWKYLELLRVLSHESTTAYMRLKLWKPSTETDWFGMGGLSSTSFTKSSDIVPPSGYESAEWIRWKTWLASTGAYTPKFYWMSVHSECHDVPMDEIDLLQGVTWDAEEATGTMSAGGIDTNSSRLRWCHDINIKANQPAGSIYVDIDESISNGTPYAGTLVVTDAQYPNISTFDDLIEYSSCDDDRFVLPKQWVVKADQNSGKSYVDVSKGGYAPFYIKANQEAGVTYVDIDRNIPSDTPSADILIVKDSVTYSEIELEYSSGSGDRFTLVNESYTVKTDQAAGELYVDVNSTINIGTPSEGSLKVKNDVMVYTSYSGDRFTVPLTSNAYTTADIVTAAVTPENYQMLDEVRFPRACMDITLPQTGYINVNGDPMEYTSWVKDRFTVTPATPNDYDKGDGVGIGTPRAYTTSHYVEPQCNVILEGEELAGKWMQIDISGVSTEQVEALVRPAVWLRPDWIAIEIPLNMSWSESVVGKVWSGYCIDQNDAHIVSSEGGYLTLISDRNNTALNIVNTSCMVETNGFFQVFMKGDYEDWEFTMKRVTSDRIFDPGYRQYPSGSSVAFDDVIGGYDLKFWVVPPEDICPKSIAHLDSLATY